MARFANILQTIGNTPLVRLNRLTPEGVNVYVKVEAFNPMGSVKDRMARAIQREPELPELIQRIVCVGGAWREAGNASAVSEFHFYCDPAAARLVLHSRATITLLPLDVTRKILLSPTDLLELPAPESTACRFLRQIVPHGIRATAGLYGVEGFHLKDVLALVAVKQPELLTLKPMSVDEAALEVGGDQGAFIVFRNATTDTVNVLFRRPDGNLGLIEPE